MRVDPQVHGESLEFKPTAIFGFNTGPFASADRSTLDRHSTMKMFSKPFIILLYSVKFNVYLGFVGGRLDFHGGLEIEKLRQTVFGLGGELGCDFGRLG